MCLGRPNLLEGLQPGSAGLDREVLVEQGAVEALDPSASLRAGDAVGLRPLQVGLAMLDALKPVSSN